jgi:hypothetical protein
MASDQQFHAAGRGSFSVEVLQVVLSVPEMDDEAVLVRPLHDPRDVAVDDGEML